MWEGNKGGIRDYVLNPRAHLPHYTIARSSCTEKLCLYINLNGKNEGVSACLRNQVQAIEKAFTKSNLKVWHDEF